MIVEKELMNDVSASFESPVGSVEGSSQELNLNYKLNDTVSIIGIYEDRKETESQRETRDESGSLGVDLKLTWNVVVLKIPELKKNIIKIREELKRK